MTTSLFKSAFGAIARARTHIDTLDGMIFEFSERLQTPTWEIDASRTLMRFTSPVTSDEVDEVGEVIGDAAHRLRAALDRMAVELVRISGGNPNRVHFPMGTDAANLEAQIKEKHFDRAGGDAVTVLRKFQPHFGPGGNILLRTLHDFDIVDKHQAVLQLRQAMVMPTVFHTEGYFGANTVIGPVGEQVSIVQRFGEIEAVRAPLRHPQMEPALDLIFGPGHPLEDRRAIPVLYEMSDVVQDVVETFAALCAARN